MIKTGVAVGAGMQSIVAFVNLGSYYAIGVPLGLILTYVFNLGVKVLIKLLISSFFLYFCVHFIESTFKTLIYFRCVNCRDYGLECWLELLSKL